jgi:UDP-N-acetylglucosamine diphosphorylase / glucose-1-phosphate thymidylyltransferase / UDP-N-acetylgalactosamine diphosphorylase / glucosamine-1-phosphate N-acetyltransferase / galactosamine-1-phosphate N-acetyltransferase
MKEMSRTQSPGCAVPLAQTLDTSYRVMMNSAVLLAAGKGSRMQHLTEDLPKPMLPVAGKPMLEHILDRMRAAGFERFLIVIGYRGEIIKDHFRNYPASINYLRQDPVDGTATAALLAREFAGDGDFLLSFGDILTESSVYAGLRDLLAAHPATQGVLAVKQVEDPWMGAAVYETGGVISRVVEKPPRGSSSTSWNSAGLYCFRAPLVFSYLNRVERSERGEFELTAAFDLMLADGLELRTYPILEPWRDVGRPDDLDEAERIARG